ncbi:MTRF1L release factor glutamine methyltransferase-like [Lineus longissimus]|uniref:MTRF1L release factor glutamine methyltransferase-like n=1 Tax=Lineus longissimus TaxID=88925 RepID=UPI002B4CAD54
MSFPSRLFPVGSRIVKNGCLGMVAAKGSCQMCTEIGKHVPPPSVGVVKRNWTHRFTQEGIFEPSESAEFIIAHALGEKSLINVNHARRLTKEQIETIRRLCKERLTGKPIQYVIGEWDFHGIKVDLKPPVLIPRPETEHLVDLAITDIQDHRSELFRCLEIGCGSGAISLALLRAFPQVHMTAIDLSPTACDLTKHNAAKCGVIQQMDVHCLDLTEETVNNALFSKSQYELIISNPPYVCTQEIAELRTEIRDFEDHKALDGGPDGLRVIKFVLAAANNALCEDGSLWLEVGDEHAKLIPDFVKEMDLQYIGTHEDFTKTPRFCHLRKSSTKKS